MHEWCLGVCSVRDDLLNHVVVSRIDARNVQSLWQTGRRLSDQFSDSSQKEISVILSYVYVRRMMEARNFVYPNYFCQTWWVRIRKNRNLDKVIDTMTETVEALKRILTSVNKFFPLWSEDMISITVLHSKLISSNLGDKRLEFCIRVRDRRVRCENTLANYYVLIIFTILEDILIDTDPDTFFVQDTRATKVVHQRHLGYVSRKLSLPIIIPERISMSVRYFRTRIWERVIHLRIV